MMASYVRFESSRLESLLSAFKLEYSFEMDSAECEAIRCMRSRCMIRALKPCTEGSMRGCMIITISQQGWNEKATA